MKYQTTQLDFLEVGKTSTYYGHRHKGQRHVSALTQTTLEITKWDLFQTFLENILLKNYILSLQSNNINS
jgi:hypothetical protein